MDAGAVRTGKSRAEAAAVSTRNARRTDPAFPLSRRERAGVRGVLPAVALTPLTLTLSPSARVEREWTFSSLRDE
jgi:hypothetical protein